MLAGLWHVAFIGVLYSYHGTGRCVADGVVQVAIPSRLLLLLPCPAIMHLLRRCSKAFALAATWSQAWAPLLPVQCRHKLSSGVTAHMLAGAGLPPVQHSCLRGLSRGLEQGRAAHVLVMLMLPVQETV